MLRGIVTAFAVISLAACAKGPKPRFIDAGRPIYQISSAQAPEPDAVAEGNGGFIFDGGGPISRGFGDEIVKAAGPVPVICIIVTANDGQSELYHAFDHTPAATLHILNLNEKNAADPQALDVLGRCSAYVFDGGEPARLAAVLLDATGAKDGPALQVIRQGVATRHAALAGRGAGAMMLGSFGLCECSGKSSLNALTEGRLTEAPGFGFYQGPLIDTHYFTQGLLGRHIAAMRKHRIDWGLGIDENAAVSLDQDGNWTLTGDGQVALVHIKEARSDGSVYFRLSILRPGDRIDGNGTILPSEKRVASTPVIGTDPEPTLIENVFGPNILRDMITRLFDTQSQQISGTAGDGSVIVDLAIGPDTQIFHGADGNTILALEGRIRIQ